MPPLMHARMQTRGPLTFLLEALHTFSDMFIPFLSFSDIILDAPLDARPHAEARALSYLLRAFHTFSDLFKPFLTF